ncbi:hypothetical protein Trydic_g9996, partial [Trypoxylus dichotomus]
ISIEKSPTYVDPKIILKAEEISKRYFAPCWTRRRFFSTPVENLSLELTKGTCLGLLGVKGAGKSTSFRILAKEIEPTTGKLNVKVGISLGYCPQENALIDEFTGRELLTFYGNLRNEPDLKNTVNGLLKKFADIGGITVTLVDVAAWLSVVICVNVVGICVIVRVVGVCVVDVWIVVYISSVRVAIGEYLGLMGMDTYNIHQKRERERRREGLYKIADRPCCTYSGGNKRKLSTCISIIGFPSCILLDEPTSGVDPVSRRELWDLIEGIKSDGEKAIVLTSHSMDECEALCDRLCILKEGKVVKQASIESLKKAYCVGHTVDLKFRKPTLSSKSTMEETHLLQSSSDNLSLTNKYHILEYLRYSFEKRNVDILEINNIIMRVQIRNSDWSTIFKYIEALTAYGKYNIEDYCVKEASLAEVLMSIAKEDNFP